MKYTVALSQRHVISQLDAAVNIVLPLLAAFDGTLSCKHTFVVQIPKSLRLQSIKHRFSNITRSPVLLSLWIFNEYPEYPEYYS